MEQEQQEQKQARRPDSDRFWKFATVALIVVLAVFAFRSNGGSPAAPTGGAVVDGQVPAAAPVDIPSGTSPLANFMAASTNF